MHLILTVVFATGSISAYTTFPNVTVIDFSTQSHCEQARDALLSAYRRTDFRAVAVCVPK